MTKGLQTAVVLTVALCLVTASCIGASRVVPAILMSPGVKVETYSFSRGLVTGFADGPGVNRVMSVDREGSDTFMVIAERGIRWVDEAGMTLRAVSFPRRLFRPEPVRLLSGETRLVALAGNHVAVLDVEGRVRHRFKTAGPGYKWPIAGNVAGDGEPEVILRKRTGADIRTLAGALVASLEWPRYTTFVEVMQADADEPLEVVLFNTHLGRPEVEVRVVNADGSVVSDWALPRGNWLSLIPALGMDRLWAAVDDEIIAYSATGEIVSRLSAPGAGYLRYVTGARLNDTTILVVSGGGYRCQSLLLVYDADRQLVYQEAVANRSYTVWADPRGAAFYVGSGEEFYRYTRAEAKVGTR